MINKYLSFASGFCQKANFYPALGKTFLWSVTCTCNNACQASFTHNHVQTEASVSKKCNICDAIKHFLSSPFIEMSGALKFDTFIDSQKTWKQTISNFLKPFLCLKKKRALGTSDVAIQTIFILMQRYTVLMGLPLQVMSGKAYICTPSKIIATHSTQGCMSTGEPLNSHEWPREDFPLQYQYNFKKIRDENKGNYQ